MANTGILLTGFEPFGGERVNPSWLVAQALHGERVGGACISAVQLPCVFATALPALDAALARHRPALVLCLGQAAGRAGFSLERIAINVDDADSPDNAGSQPVDACIVPGAPAAHFTNLPIKPMLAALRAAGHPASVSDSAGTFVCNHVFFGLMQRLRRRPRMRGGFMHLPLLPQQAARHAGLPSLPLETMVDGVRIALAAAADPART